MALTITPYVTIDEAWDYFNTRLEIRDWQMSTDDQRNRALAQATRLIDRLRFKGCKLVHNQANAFPRVINNNYDVSIPDAIKIATCEVAITLLDGTDIEQEIENLFAKSQSYAAVATDYDSDVVPDYMRAGIPSAVAWNYLRPYLCNPFKINLSRVD
jgi:hypothetical protein